MGNKRKENKGKGMLTAQSANDVLSAVASTVTGVVMAETPSDSNVDTGSVQVQEVTTPTDAPIAIEVQSTTYVPAPMVETVDAPMVTVATEPVAAKATNETTPVDAVATPAGKAMYAIASKPVTLPVSDDSSDEKPVTIGNKRAMAMACVYVACDYYGCKPSDSKALAIQLASKLFVTAGGGYCATKGCALIGEISVQGARGYIAGYAMHAWEGGKNSDASKRHKVGGDKHSETLAHMAMVRAAGKKYAKLLGIEADKLTATK